MDDAAIRNRFNGFRAMAPSANLGWQSPPSNPNAPPTACPANLSEINDYDNYL